MESSGIYIYLIPLVALALIGLVIFLVTKALKKCTKSKRKALVTSIACFLTVAVSWVFNMGWYRFGLIVVFPVIPIIGTGMLFLTNVAAASCFEHSRRIKALNLLFIITYLVGNLLFPDGGDIGGMYFFFGLIRSNALAYVASAISGLAFVIHIGLFIWQIAEISNLKSRLKKKAETVAGEIENTDS